MNPHAITLTADGLSASQLPDIKITMPAGIKHYSDQAVTNDQMTTAGIVGTRQQNIAIIPSRQGEMTLPEITLDWWNTKTQRSETLRIAARTIQVEPSDTASSQAVGHEPDAEGGQYKLVSKPSVVENQAGFWPWLSLMLVMGWIGTFIVMRAQKRQLLMAREQETVQAEKVIPSQTAASKALKTACFSNDPATTKDALLTWAQAYSTDSQITSLAGLAGCTNDAIADELEKLKQVLYSQTSMSWKGEALWKLIDLYNKSGGTKKTTNNSKQVLAPLYP